ncbi:hypothetical protein PC39_11807 [Salinisphaera sp. PC39]|uniref:hypothetical protein n=1 Tax=Salinisphaera sp. PC39 TaxID=1304156 RepID=UPI0033419B73
MRSVTMMGAATGMVAVMGLAACGAGGGGSDDDGVPGLDAASPADLTRAEEVAKRYLLLAGESLSTPREFDELASLARDLRDQVDGADGTYSCDQGFFNLQTGEIESRDNPFGPDDGFDLLIITASECEAGSDRIDGLLETGERTAGAAPVFYVGGGESEGNKIRLREGDRRLIRYMRLFQTESGGVERVSGRALARDEFPDDDAAEQLDLLGLNGVGFFELVFDESASPATFTGEGRVRVDRRSATGERCGARGTFDFEVTQPIELDSGGEPMAGEIELAADGHAATVTVGGGGIVVTIDGVQTDFDPADLAALEPEVSVCTSDDA